MSDNNSKALVAYQPRNLEELKTVGGILAKSGFFSDTKSEAQAVAKIMAGMEMGFTPMQAMTGIHLIKGKVAVGANLMAQAIKRHPRYDYRVKALTKTECTIIIYQDGSEIGVSSFTMDDAKSAGVTGNDTWKKYPKNMLFARCISNAIRFYCPDAIAGAYTPEEMGAAVDEDGAMIDDAPPVDAIEGEVVQDEPVVAGDDMFTLTKDEVTGLYEYAKSLGITSRDDVYEALGVEDINDFREIDPFHEAKDCIDYWLEQQLSAEQSPLIEADEAPPNHYDKADAPKA